MDKLDCFNGSKVMVTGGTGFKGSWLCCWLSLLGAEVYVIADKVPTEPSNFLDGGVDRVTKKWVAIDICDGYAIRQAIFDLKPDYVFHLAAQPLVPVSYREPQVTWAVNCLGTVNLLESLVAVDWPLVGVFVTSDKVYKNVEWCWGYRENDALGGFDPYSASKGAAEFAINSYFRSFLSNHGFVKLAVGRAGNVIGGGDWSSGRIIPDIVRHSVSGTTLKLRNPHATRPWQHVLEPLGGYLRLAQALYANEADVNGQAFNFGPNPNALQTVEQVVVEFDKSWSTTKINWIEEKGSFYEAGLLKLNCDKALSTLGWKPTWSFERTIQKTAAWYSKFYNERAGAERTQLMLDLTRNQIYEYVNDAG